MTLLAPWALWFLVLGGAVVALYLLRIKRRQVAVPALDFWLDLAGRTRVHTLWDRLKRFLSMLLWLVIVVCIVLALGNPLVSAGRIRPRSIAVVIDNSASMQSVEPSDGGRTRLAAAIEAVSRATSTRPVSDEWLIIEAGPEPRVLQPWTLDAAAARRAAAAIRPFQGPGSLRAAVELAAQLTAGKNDPCTVVISDGAAGAIAPLAHANNRIVYWPIGRSDDNLGITRLAVRADRRRANYQVLVAVVNASAAPVKTQLTLSIDGSTQSVEPIEIEPQQTWEKTVVLDPPAGVLASGAVLKAEIDRADDLAVDNQALAILEPTRPAVVWLVTPADNAYFFEQALATMDPLVWPEQSLTMTPERYEQAAAIIAAPPATQPPAADAPRPPDLVVFNGCTPRRLPDRGRFVCIGSLPVELGATVAGRIESPQIFLDPRPHPITEHISLQGARLAQALDVSLGQPARTLASTADGKPLVFLSEQGDRQTLCISFSVLESDLPFRNAFPLLLRNTVAFMHTEASPWLRPRYRIGETITPTRPLPGELTTLPLQVLSDPRPQPINLEVRDGRFAYTKTDHPSALSFSVGEETALTAIALLDAAETRTAPVPAPSDPAQALGLSRRLFSTVPWVALAALAMLLIALEWLTYHLRWTE